MNANNKSRHLILKNNICEFEVLNNRHLLNNKNINCVSSVFFKMNKHYKNFNTYVYGLRKTVSFIGDVNRILPSNERFIYILFIDKNIHEDKYVYSTIKACRFMVPILYKCARYMDDQKKFHVDLFGSLIRFMPMFNFKNNPFKCIISADIELKDKHLNVLKDFMIHKPPGVSFRTYMPAKMFFQHSFFGVLAGIFIFNREKVDSKVFTDFVTNAHNIKDTGPYGERHNAFEFGVDELFLRRFFIPSVEKYQIHVKYTSHYFIYHSIEYLTRDEKTIDITRRLLHIISDNTMNDTKSDGSNISSISSVTDIDLPNEENIAEDFDIKKIEDTQTRFLDSSHDNMKPKINDEEVMKMIEHIDSYLYDPEKIKTYRKISNDISERIYLLVDHLYKNNKSWIRQKIINIIHKYLMNVISATLYVEFDYETTTVTNIIKYDTIYTNHKI